MIGPLKAAPEVLYAGRKSQKSNVQETCAVKGLGFRLFGA